MRIYKKKEKKDDEREKGNVVYLLRVPFSFPECIPNSELNGFNFSQTFFLSLYLHMTRWRCHSGASSANGNEKRARIFVMDVDLKTHASSSEEEKNTVIA